MQIDTALPTYLELEETPRLGLRNAWRFLDPELGTMGLLTSAHALSASALVTTGECVTFNVSLGEIDPPLFGREPLQHTVTQIDRNNFEDVLDGFNPQSASQWDGLGHVRAREFGFFGGIEDPGAGSRRLLTIESIARRGIAGRGVLVDVPRWAAETGRPWNPLDGTPLEVQDLREILDTQHVELQLGDILCLRFGWLDAYRALSVEERSSERLSQRFSGLRAYEPMAEFLWDAHVSAVCADNPALEAAPGSPGDGSLHRRLIPMLGMTIGELFDFEYLSLRCRDLQRNVFMFVAAPLPVPGGISSPSNAMGLL